MGAGITFPIKIKNIVIIDTDNSELGVLTYGSVQSSPESGLRPSRF